MPTIRTKNESRDPLHVSRVEQSEEESLTAPIVPVENNPDIEQYAKDLAFMNETVEVTLSPSFDPTDTTQLVDIHVNGKVFWFMRGQPTKVPRYVLAVLATAKTEAFQFGYRMGPDGRAVQTTDSHRVLRFPHQFNDVNPKGQKWYAALATIAY